MTYHLRAEFNAKDPRPDYRVTSHFGLSIWKLKGVPRFQVRLYQRDLQLWHVWSPWCDSLEEAKAVAEKLVAEQ